MAQLVLANPTITAKKLAQKMGYAEQKPVYYRSKKRATGDGVLKKAVLPGCFQFANVPGEAQAAKDVRGPLYRPYYCFPTPSSAR